MTPNHAPVVLTPAMFASQASGGIWRGAPHLNHMNAVLLDVAYSRAKGVRRNIIINAPPRHGKSLFISQYFSAWWLCNFPDDQVLLTAYEANFAADWGTVARETFERMCGSYRGRDGKPLRLSDSQTASSRWAVANHSGIMRTAGAGGAILGKGYHLGIIDDPIKNSEDALSEHFNEGLWNWWLSTVRTRREPGSCTIVMMQRWMEHDLVARMLAMAEEGGDQWEVYSYKAIAEEGDILGREPGEALWPWKESREDLETTRRTSPFWFAAQYQQDPRVKGGDIFKGEWFRGPKGERIVAANSLPPFLEYCRFWDRAGSAGKGDYTVGCLVARTRDGFFYVLDVVRGQWSEHERNRQIVRTSESDRRRYGNRVKIASEQEGGSSGKDVAAQFTRMLAGFRVRTFPVTGSKFDFNLLWAEQVEAGNVRVVQASWTDEFIREHEAYREKGARHDDQVDAAAGAFSQVVDTKRSTFAAGPTRGYAGKRAGDVRFGGRKTRLKRISYK